MEPFAFVVCTQLCLIQPPTQGQPRDVCVARARRVVSTGGGMEFPFCRP